MKSHEELIIEKRAASKMKSSTTTLTSEPSPPTSPEELVQTKTEINIPLMREEIIISKKPYVKEEIVIKKKPVIETKTVTEQITSERVSIRNSAGELVEEIKKQDIQQNGEKRVEITRQERKKTK